jgi:ankyrin repeat protein
LCATWAQAAESAACAGGSRVADAVRDGNAESLRALLKEHCDVNAPQADGTYALHWAARSDDGTTIDLLLRAGARPNVANRYGITPLALAAQTGDAALVEKLLSAGADPNAAMADGETALMFAARAGRAEPIKALVAHGAKVDAKENWLGETALIWAAAANNAEAIRTLVALGAGVDTPSASITYPPQNPSDPGNYSETAPPKGGWTPLMYAAREGASDAALTLVSLDANINKRDPEGVTPLIEAIVNMHYDLAAALIGKGADPNIADSAGMTPLYAVIDMHTPQWERSRPDPMENDSLDCLGMMKVLLDHGANPNAALTKRTLMRMHANGPGNMAAGTTPLIRAVRYSNFDIVQLLLERGADPNLTQADGTNALMVAAGVKYAFREDGDPIRSGTPEDALEIVKLLVEKKGQDVNAANKRGETPLYGAAFIGRDAIITYLAEHGARADVKTQQGLTILDGALNTGIPLEGTGARAFGRPGESTIQLVRQLMDKAGVPPAQQTKAGSAPRP